MVDIPTISAVLAAASVIVGVLIALLEIRHMARARRTDVIMRIYERFSSKEWYESTTRVTGSKFVDFDDYRKKYGLVDIVQVALLFDEVGVLLEQNLIDIKLADSLFGDSATLMWKTCRPAIQEIRNHGSQPRMFSHFDYLQQKLDSQKRDHKKTR